MEWILRHVGLYLPGLVSYEFTSQYHLENYHILLVVPNAKAKATCMLPLCIYKCRTKKIWIIAECRTGTHFDLDSQSAVLREQVIALLFCFCFSFFVSTLISPPCGLYLFVCLYCFVFIYQVGLRSKLIVSLSKLNRLFGSLKI
jgi:hypothetical protein